MANYSLVINSQFKPFSYAELLAPVHATTEAHEKLADKYDSLSLLASPWQNRLNKEVDKNAYATVEDYVGALESQRDVLESYGLTPDARRQFSLLRGRYAKDIIPVEEGWKMKQADITRQQQIQDRTGGLTIFDRDARTTSVDDYIAGNVKDFNQVNLETVRNYGTMSGSAYSKRKINISEGNAFGGDYLKMVKTYGVSAEEAAEIMKAAMDRSNKYPEVQALLDEMRNSVGYDNFDAAGKKKIDSALIKGFVDGLVYDQQIDIRNNWRAEKAVDLNNQITMENLRAKHERDLADYNHSLANPTGSDIPGFPTPYVEFLGAKGISTKTISEYYTKTPEKDGGERYALKNPEALKKVFGLIDPLIGEKKSLMIKDSNGKYRFMTPEEFEKKHRIVAKGEVPMGPLTPKFIINKDMIEKYKQFYQITPGIQKLRAHYDKNNKLVFDRSSMLDTNNQLTSMYSSKGQNRATAVIGTAGLPSDYLDRVTTRINAGGGANTFENYVVRNGKLEILTGGKEKLEYADNLNSSKKGATSNFTIQDIQFVPHTKQFLIIGRNPKGEVKNFVVTNLDSVTKSSAISNELKRWADKAINAQSDFEADQALANMQDIMNNLGNAAKGVNTTEKESSK